MLNSENKTMNQGAVISNITKAIKDLIVVIEKENDLLRVGQVSAISAIVEEKVEALHKFNEAQVTVEEYARSGEKFDKNSTLMLKLKELFGVLNKLNRDNDILIRSNLEVSNKIVEIYKESRAQETLRQFGYNKDGKVSVAGKIDKVMPSIGLNNKV
jgi:flagellar biosynthesis/type III secretory pathway chaperone